MLGLENAHLRIGHNGGPPLDVGYHAWVWRRAHAQAWKTPAREIALLRMRNAERLGLDYRTYASVLMDRGTRLETMLLMVDAASFAFEDIVLAKLARLVDCTLILCTSERSSEISSFLPMARFVIANPPSDGPIMGDYLRHQLREFSLVPASVFMVGTAGQHRAAAVRAGLGTFVETWDYFGLGAV